MKKVKNETEPSNYTRLISRRNQKGQRSLLPRRKTLITHLFEGRKFRLFIECDFCNLELQRKEFRPAARTRGTGQLKAHLADAYVNRRHALSGGHVVHPLDSKAARAALVLRGSTEWPELSTSRRNLFP